jgi:hypothetical protein
MSEKGFRSDKCNPTSLSHRFILIFEGSVLNHNSLDHEESTLNPVYLIL